MNIEVMIYVYMAVCTAMILFNCAVVMVNGRQRRQLERPNPRLCRRIARQFSRLREGKTVEQAHLWWLERRLRRLGNLRVFDMNVESLQKSSTAETAMYLDALHSVFLALSARYCGRDALKATYFAYVVRKYHLVHAKGSDGLLNRMLGLLSSPSVYARENALHVIYDLGDPERAVQALRILDEGHTFHHPKLIHDGLLAFAENREALLSALWRDFDRFSYEMQTTLVNYMRLSGGGCDEQIFALMTRPGQNDEVYFACMRYFGRFCYVHAYPILLEALRGGKDKRWELAAVAAAVLRSYPGERTVELLKEALHSSAWYVRVNAAESLEALGVSYADLASVFEGEDRYAREILQYRMDYRSAKGEKGGAVPV